MPFSGKPTYSAGADLPELMEDVTDLVSVISPYETPLLDALGDGARPAYSTIHEWVEDELLPNTDTINQTTFTPSAASATSVTVQNGARFRPGDLVRPAGSREIIQVTAVSGNTLTVVRQFSGTASSSVANAQRLTIIGSPALEGDDKPDARYTNRSRKPNYTQIFTASVEVSGSMLATRPIGVRDEMEYQKQQRLREMLRDLENSVINGVALPANQQGSASAKRSMNGVLAQVATNQMAPGTGTIPAGGGAGTDLSEAVLNAALRQVWEGSSSSIDLILCPAPLKRRINAFASASRRTEMGSSTFSDLINIYESDFGVCRVIMSRFVPSDTLIFLDSSRIEVLPLQGRSFAFKKLATTGDRESGQVIGEYTLEMRNEAAHGVLRNLT